MRICKDCKFSEQKVLNNGQQLFTGLICTHTECRDVLDGNPIPCLPARQAPQYCGFEAKYYKVKEEKPDNVVSLIQTK